LGFTRSTLWAVRVCSNPVLRLLCFVDCLSPGPRKNDLTIYWAFGPFGRSFISLVDPGDIYPPQVPNEIVIEAMIKGLRPGPTAQYFARKPPQTLEKLLQKMDEYIQADNDFHQRREEAYRFSEMTRGFGGRVHPRHVRSIHNSTQSDDKGSQSQKSQYTSQSSGQQ
jgi:hypothetical protein